MYKIIIGHRRISVWPGLPVWLLGLAILTGCGGGGSGSPATQPPVASPAAGTAAATPQLSGAGDALLTSAIDNFFLDDPVIFTETELDANGRRIERTRLRIGFTELATVDEGNALLTELGATITSSLAGLPALVVRIPDPGSLLELDRLISNLVTRTSVSYVTRSTMQQANTLPGNIEELIFGQGLPETATEWGFVAPQLAVRAHAAWNASAATHDASGNPRRPNLIVGDFFGQGEARSDVFDIQPLGDFKTEFKDENLPTYCSKPKPDQEEECESLSHNRGHGYLVLGIAAGRHSKLDKQDPADLISGMVPDGVNLSVVDQYKRSSLQFDNLLLLETLKRVTAQREGMVIVNLSIGDRCDKNRAPQEPCQEVDDIRSKVRYWIRGIRDNGLEQRVLIVTAAGNRIVLGNALYEGPMDARTGSEYNAASLYTNWSDDRGMDLLPALTNTLVVENVRRTPGPPEGKPPFLSECTAKSSFTGGHLGGIGSGGISSSIGGVSIDTEDDGGTSSATPQVAGLAAYMSALKPQLTPQRAIALLTAVAANPGNGKHNECAPTAGADLIDAYAAVLALDSRNEVSLMLDADIRLALLDIAGPEGAPDGVFDSLDLQEWLVAVDPEAESGAGTLNYGRYDLNGDGYEGGRNTARFDLDISDVTQAGAFSIIKNAELNEALSVDLRFDENAVTDLQVLCYYAYSDLYFAGAQVFDPTVRDAHFSQLKDDCGINVGISVKPESDVMQPGDIVQFAATVTGFTDTNVIWRAEGGTIDTTGNFTAGDTPGEFSVTATSAVDPTTSATATVNIESTSLAGRYVGAGTVYDSGKCESRVDAECVTWPTVVTVEQLNDELTITMDVEFSVSGTFSGLITSGHFEGLSILPNFACEKEGAEGCPITGEFIDAGSEVTFTARAYVDVSCECYVDFVVTRE